MTTAAIIQARMGSTRLPNKVLADIEGITLLDRVIARVKRSETIDKILIATTTSPKDDAIVTLAERAGVSVWRGSEDDVLARYYEAAKAFQIETIVRITGDCPLIDPEVIDEVVALFNRSAVDYASNIGVSTYPDGLDVEVFSFDALRRNFESAHASQEREHVTPWLRSSDTVRRADMTLPNRRNYSQMRWTVDDPADLDFVRAVYAKLAGREFTMWDVIALIESDDAIQDAGTRTVMNEGHHISRFTDAVAGKAPLRPQIKSAEWAARSAKVIPTGAQTFSKASNQYVANACPVFLQRGKGAKVWDVDGNEYVDFVQGLLPNILGYAHDEVNAEFASQAAEGHSFSLPHPLEVQLAERLVEMIPCAEMVRFGKNGSDATSGAVRAARAYTGRERIACCGYHGWQDWYIGSTTRNAGVPLAVRELTHPFPYNDVDALEALLSSHAGEFAAVIMEPVNFTPPAPGFLLRVKELAAKHGAVLIFDEICTGFHWGLGGAQKLFGVTPDMACFGKAMGNGYPISCVVGSAEIMPVFDDIFYSFTFAGEVGSLAAAMKVLDILETTDALAVIANGGRLVQDGINTYARLAGIQERIECVGYPYWPLTKFRDAAGKDSLLVRSLFTQEASKRGILGLATHNMTAAHTMPVIDGVLREYAAIMKTLAQWLSDPDPSVHLDGPMVQPVFRVR